VVETKPEPVVVMHQLLAQPVVLVLSSFVILTVLMQRQL
jgi:hypothetical protein